MAKLKPVVINPDSIEYDSTNLSKFEITGIRYGIKNYFGWNLTGIIYIIELKSITGKVFKIRFKGRKQAIEQYKQIVYAIVENFIDDISKSLITQFNNKSNFELLGITFSQEGIKFDSKSEIIPWAEVGTRNYHRYYSIFSTKDSHNYRIFLYLTDWNTVVMYSVSRYILKSKERKELLRS